MEIYKDVLGYEGLYQVSNLGNVKSLNFNNTKKEKLMKITFDGKYNRVNLSKNGKNKFWLLHQLIAVNFLNHTPNGFKLVVNHKDFNRLNNNVDNLEIITQRENANQKHLKSSSIYTGVSLDKNKKKWVANIVIDKKLNYLGSFINEYEAHLAYEKALRFVLNQSKV